MTPRAMSATTKTTSAIQNTTRHGPPFFLRPHRLCRRCRGRSGHRPPGPDRTLLRSPALQSRPAGADWQTDGALRRSGRKHAGAPAAAPAKNAAAAGSAPAGAVPAGDAPHAPPRIQRPAGHGAAGGKRLGCAGSQSYGPLNSDSRKTTKRRASLLRQRPFRFHNKQNALATRAQPVLLYVISTADGQDATFSSRRRTPWR